MTTDEVSRGQMGDKKNNFVYRNGTHRLRPPEETIKTVQPYLASMGITRVADVTGLDTIGIPVVMVCRPNARSVSVSQGKGCSLDAAKASGIMESIEGFHAENINLPLRVESYNEICGVVNAVDLQELPEVEDSPCHSDMTVTWIESDDLFSGDKYWLPYEMVHTNYTDPRPSGYGFFPASSNGLASGNNIDEATVHRICEVIERDAVSLWHLFGRKAIDSTSVDIGTIDSALCIETLEKLHRAGQDTYIWDITTDTAIPSYLAVILDRDSHTRHIGLGSGTHLSREVALLRALHEAVQVRTTYIVGARDDITLDEYTSQGIEAKQSFFRHKVKQSSFSGHYDRTVDLDSDTVEQDLDTLFTQLKQVDITQILRVDLTKAELGIAVVRVVIPGLEAPHDDEGYVKGIRGRQTKTVFGR